MGRETRTLELRFIKGHMGGNTIALLPGEDIPEEHVLETALLALRDTHLGCHEAGLLYPSSSGSGLRMRIVGRSSKAFISACGGLTQVLGAAIAGGELKEVFGFGPCGTAEVVLGTDGGPVSLRINAGGRQSRTETDMTCFLEKLHRDGIEPIDLDGIRAVRAGKFLVICADELAGRFTRQEIEGLSPQVRQVLTKLQGLFLAGQTKASLDFALYDLHPEHPGNLGRVVFPHWLPAGHVEPACGTGTVAVCAALSLLGKAGTAALQGSAVLKFESGGGPTLGGPDVTTAFLQMGSEKIDSIRFSHSLVELTSRGKVMLKTNG